VDVINHRFYDTNFNSWKLCYKESALYKCNILSLEINFKFLYKQIRVVLKHMKNNRYRNLMENL
jgi:hypothetical protein